MLLLEGSLYRVDFEHGIDDDTSFIESDMVASLVVLFILCQ